MSKVCMRILEVMICNMMNSKKAWSEKFNYLYIDMSKIRKEGRYRIFKESKTTYNECIPESEPF